MKSYQEWFDQADYDVGTAEAMHQTGRYIYVVFMCHLCLEKALKGIFTDRLGQEPPKIHDLTYFVKKIGLNIPTDKDQFLDKLNQLNIVTRYPDNLSMALKDVDRVRSQDTLNQTQEVLSWLKTQL